jgi:hypothetical protein
MTALKWANLSKQSPAGKAHGSLGLSWKVKVLQTFALPLGYRA